MDKNQTHMERYGHILCAQMELHFAACSFAEGESARGNVELFEAAAEVFRALGFADIDAYIRQRDARERGNNFA